MFSGKVHQNTLKIEQYRRFAKVCVEMDLAQPVLRKE
jgi:hypothetical protein